MVFIFGVDVPLVELILAFSLITFIMLLEVTVVMILLFYQLKHSRRVTERLIRVTHILLHLAKKDKRDLDKLSMITGSNNDSSAKSKQLAGQQLKR